MTEVTRAKLEACARLLPFAHGVSMLSWFDHHDDVRAVDREALARAAKLIVNYADQCVGARMGSVLLSWRDNKDGTESACIIKAAAAVQIEREKQQ